MKRLKIIKQFSYNAIATVLPTIVLQIIILPFIANKMDSETYGLLLTLIAVITMIAAGIGNVLNNAQLLSNNEYQEKHLTGDFGVLFWFNIIILIPIMIGISAYYEINTIKQYILIIFLTISMFAKEYYIVMFWIDLDYLGILKCNLVCVLGYIIGAGYYWIGGDWQYIYIFGNVFAFIYIIKRYKFSALLIKRTSLFKKTLKKVCVMTATTILARALQYIDRILLYPMLGGGEVSIYYVSTLMGKTIGMALLPINSFMLSQLAKKNEMNKKIFGKLLLVTFIMGVLVYFICIGFASPLLHVLYPQWANDAMIFVPITTITAVLSAMSLIINPIVLRFCNINWQLLISGGGFIVYVISSMILLKTDGLIGFCLGGMLSNLVSLLMMIGIYFYVNRREKERLEYVRN